MADEPANTPDDSESSEHHGAVQALEHPAQEVTRVVEEHVPEAARTPAPGLLPGELQPHPSPVRYVMIAVILVVVTAGEVGLYYLQGDMPDNLMIVLLLMFALVKFSLVASWYMHLKTDMPIFRRFFVLGIIAAISLYLIVLSTLHVFG